MTVSCDNSIAQAWENFRHDFVFLIFGDKNFAGDKRNARVEVRLKLCKEFPCSQFHIEDYTFPPYGKDRNKHDGGLMVFAKNDLITKQVKELESDSLEIICLELAISRKNWVIFSF